MTISIKISILRPHYNTRNQKQASGDKMSTNKLEIKKTTHESIDYYSTVVRGIDYLIYKNSGEWRVKSSRVALGGNKKCPGTWRYFNTLEEVEKRVKNLKGLNQILIINRLRDFDAYVLVSS